jgi:hypothetical protein
MVGGEEHLERFPGMKSPMWLLTCVALCMGGCLDDRQSPGPQAANANFAQAPVVSDSPSDCNALLIDGVFDEHDKLGSKYETRFFLRNFCSAHYTSLQDAQNASMNSSVPVGDLMQDFGFSENSSTFQTDYATLCDHQESYLESNQQAYEKIRTADENLAREFRLCKQNQTGLVAYLEPTDTTQFQIIATFKPISRNHPYASSVSLLYDKRQGQCDDPQHTDLGPEGLVINCSRSDDTKAFQAALNTDSGSKGFTFPPKEAPISAQYKWVKQTASVRANLVAGQCLEANSCPAHTTDMKKCSADTLGVRIYEAAGIESKPWVEPLQGTEIEFPDEQTAIICGQARCGYDHPIPVDASVYICEKI